LRKSILASLLFLALVACSSQSRSSNIDITQEVRGTPLLDQPTKTARPVQPSPFVTPSVEPDVRATSEPGCPALLPAVIPDVEAANVRSGPGTSFKILGELPPNQALSILSISQNGEWLQIPYGDQIGWIFSGVVVLGGDFADTPEQGMSYIPEGTPFDQAKNLAAIRNFTGQPELQLLFVRLDPYSSQSNPDFQSALYVDCSGHRYWVELITYKVQESAS
jgi:uncharacterized protein YgiM (DUF1202 family)